jgi:beta-lactamase superfamily II metal-dependent hydrolase
MANFEVIFMDAGQGDCTLIVYPDGSLTLVDCGSRKSGAAAFEEIFVVLGRYLPNANNTITNLVLTHPDEDHYNKLKSIVTKFSGLKISQVYYGGDIDLYKNQKDSNYTYNFLKNHTNAEALSNKTFNTFLDLRLSRAGVNVTILAANSSGDPKADDAHTKNINSVVLLVDYAVTKVFLMGDAFKETETFILDNVQQANAGKLLDPSGYTDIILKMGHHGSDTSTGQDWLQKIKPTILALSSGTLTFSSKGMPTDVHLNEAVTSTTLRSDCPPNALTDYVVFVTDTKDKAYKKFKRVDKKSGIWTTLFDVEWDSPLWYESGQSWFYEVIPKGGPYYDIAMGASSKF